MSDDERTEIDDEKSKKRTRQSRWPDEDHVTFDLKDAKAFVHSLGLPKGKGSLKFDAVDLSDCRQSDSVHFTTNCENYRDYFRSADNTTRFAKYLNPEDEGCYSIVANELGRHDGCLAVYIRYAKEPYKSVEELIRQGL